MKSKKICKTACFLIIAVLIGILTSGMFTTVFASDGITLEFKRDLDKNGIYLKSNMALNDQVMILVQYRNDVLKSVEIMPVNIGEENSCSTNMCKDFEPTDLFKGFLWESISDATPVVNSISALASEIEAPALWLDADDRSTITVIDGNVKEWRDKSGNGRNVSQSSASLRPAYNSTDKYIETDGSATFLQSSTPVMADGDFTLFWLADIDSFPTGDSAHYISENNSTDKNPNLSIFYNPSQADRMLSIRGTGNASNLTASSNYWATGKQLHILTRNNALNFDATVYRGDATDSGTLTQTTDKLADVSFDLFSIGAKRASNTKGTQVLTTYPAPCKFREIIIYEGALSNERIAEIKEYLLNKWSVEPADNSTLREGDFAEIALSPDSGDDAQWTSYYLPEGSLDKTTTPVPLVVALHSWSATYKTGSTLTEVQELAEEYGWAMVHPNFRGANKTPEACASEYAIQDIVDTVEYMKENANIDESRIYLVGASGGGHMSLMMASKHPEIWAAVSAYVPITDLGAWHEFSKSCETDEDTSNDVNTKYYANLESVCGGAPGASDAIDLEYYNRSPINFIQNAVNLPLDINVGISDGHRSYAVPIYHSLNAFNKLAQIGGYEDKLITSEQIDYMVANEEIPEGIENEATANDKTNENRTYDVLFRRTAGNTRLTIFNAGHQSDLSSSFKYFEGKTKTSAAE